jgi:hypothetical protein
MCIPWRNLSFFRWRRSVGRVTRVSLDVANLNPFVNYVTIDKWMGNDLLIRNLHTYMKDPEQLRSPLIVSGVRSLVLCVVFCR